MLVYETLSQDQPGALIVGAGLALLGAPQALRLVTRDGKGAAHEPTPSKPST